LPVHACLLISRLCMVQDMQTGVEAIKWQAGKLYLLDQRLLPDKEQYLALEDAKAVADAIRNMVVRGAPAIGITAAYGVVIAAQDRYKASPSCWKETIEADILCLANARPTAVNLAWALKRMREAIDAIKGDPMNVLLAEAQAIHAADKVANQRIGDFGAELIQPGKAVITHCNAGALATGGYGTALGVIRSAWSQQRISGVYADETRPWLQGSRLTAWELVRDDIPVTLVSDSAAAHLMRQGNIGWVIVGADRVAANGDVANKIGTYSLALAARHHGVKFMVAAPTSTIDLSLDNGEQIPIEERSEDEVLSLSGKRIAAQGVHAWNPAFDVTPASLIDAIVTEKGVIAPVNEEQVQNNTGSYIKSLITGKA